MSDNQHQPMHSTGRGGQGNIGPGEGDYIDTGITREGLAGDQGAGPYSSGRGGAGNIGGTPRSGSPAVGSQKRSDQEYANEADVRPSMKEDHHFGRGGAGNEIHTHEEGKQQEGFMDKVKQKVDGVLHK
ncbi:MAG: hypothetical protein Q9227_002455 [Pyrenula ochraceoflavens]